MISDISTTPFDPTSPTLTTTWGLVGSENAEPLPEIMLVVVSLQIFNYLPAITVQASPTIWVPAGMVIVEVTTYVPASKKMILHPAY
jgi:hypothetical protein